MIRAVQAIQKELGQVDGVTTFCEMAVPMVSRLGRATWAAPGRCTERPAGSCLCPSAPAPGGRFRHLSRGRARESDPVPSNQADSGRAYGSAPSRKLTIRGAQVCKLAEVFKLPGNPLQAVELARNKHQCREAIRQAGLPSPACYLLTSEEEVDRAAEVGAHGTWTQPLVPN